MPRPYSYGRQTLDEDDFRSVSEALHSAWLTQGPLGREFEQAIEHRFGVKHAIVVSSGTAALHLSALALGWSPGDLILTVPLTFLATVNCIEYVGATPHFIDVNPDTWTMDLDALRRTLDTLKREGRRAKAIIGVDFAGNPCAWDEISELASLYGFHTVDDACHALGAELNGRPICTADRSDAVVLSFHPVKHITTGEGGAILTNDSALAQRLRLLSTHGMTKDEASLEKNDGPWYYEMHEPGFNYRLTDIQCALGISQLRKLDAFLEERRKIAKYYDQAFAGHPYIQTPTVTRYARHAYHLYPLLIDFDHVGLPKRDFFARMNEKGISLQVHYIPVHLQPYYRRKYGFRPGDCPVSESIYAREVSIPMHPGLTGDDIAYISQAILETLRT